MKDKVFEKLSMHNHFESSFVVLNNWIKWLRDVFKAESDCKSKSNVIA